MRGHKKLVWCQKAQKYSYQSESKAMKAVVKYNDIQRAYYCSDCDGYHTTSMSQENAEKYIGLKKEEAPTSLDMVAERLKQLTQKL